MIRNYFQLDELGTDVIAASLPLSRAGCKSKLVSVPNGVKLRLSVRCRGRVRESSSVFPALLQP